jgi:hypothetical protein
MNDRDIIAEIFIDEIFDPVVFGIVSARSPMAALVQTIRRNHPS